MNCSLDTLDIHRHDEDCWDREDPDNPVLICGYADYIIHEHDSYCYDEDGNLICTLPEIKEHTHTDECYKTRTVTETIHEHTDECYEEQRVLVCTENHTHTGSCYETQKVLTCTKETSRTVSRKVLICEKPEVEYHIHSAKCLDEDGNLCCGKLEVNRHQHNENCRTVTETRVLVCDEDPGGQVETNGTEESEEESEEDPDPLPDSDSEDSLTSLQSEDAEPETDENGVVARENTVLSSAGTYASAQAAVPVYDAAGTSSEGDGTTIEKIETSWITNGAGKDRLVITTDSTGKLSATIRIEYSLSGQYNYAPGDIEIRFPSNIFMGRDGEFQGNMVLSVPEEPDTKAQFNYREEDGEIIVTNTRTLSAASQGYLELTIENINPVEIVSGEIQGDFSAQISVKTNAGNTLSKVSNSQDAQINTDEAVTSASKRGTLYESYPNWKNVTLPEGFDTSDYIYVDWYTYCFVTGNQYYTLGISDPMLDNGILLGGTLQDVQGNAGYDSDDLFSGWTEQGNNFYQHIYVAYPKEQFGEDGNTIHNTVTYTLTCQDTGKVTAASASATLFYKPMPFKVPGGSFRIDKWGVDEDGTGKGCSYGIYPYLNSHIGSYAYALNLLESGEDALLTYNVLTRGYPYPLTLGEDEDGKSLDPDDPDSYGKKEVQMESVDENLYFYNDFSTPLTSEDYEFASVEFFTPAMFSYKKTSSGSWDYVRDSSVAAPDITVSGRREDGTWIELGTVSFAGSMTITPENGASVSGNSLVFPEGILQWKMNCSTAAAGIWTAAAPTVRLFATDKARTFAEELISSSDSALALMENTCSLEVTQDGAIIAAWDEAGYDQLTSASQTYWMTKSSEVKENDQSSRTVVLSFTMNVYEQSNLQSESDYESAIKSGAIPEDTGGILWDLLPAQVSPDLSTIETDEATTIRSVKVHENWRGSGRVMLEIALSHDPQAVLLDEAGGIGEGYGDTIQVSFDGLYTWEDLSDRGNELVNVAAYGSNSDYIGTVPGLKGEPDDPDYGNNEYSKPAVSTTQTADGNLMSGLNPSNSHPSYVYASGPLSVNVPTAASTSLSKDVSVLNNGVWSDGLGENSLSVPFGGTYTYRLRMASLPGTLTSGIIFYDDLEAYHPASDKEDYGDGQWEGSFVRADVSQLEQAGVDPVIYYALEHVDLNGYVWDETDKNLPDLQDGSVWTTVCPDDPSRVRAIAVDCSKAADGSPFVLEAEKSLQVLIYMRAPEGEEAQEYVKNDDHAYNNVYMSSATTAASGEVSVHYIHHDYTRLGLKPFELTVRKVWNDQDNQDGLRPDSITVQLLQDGNAILDPVLLSEDNNWTYTYTDLSWGDAEGNAYSYSFEESGVPDGYRTGLSYDQNGNITLTNSHTPETVHIQGVKTWEDAGNEEQRPGSITVILLKNGVRYASKTASAAGGWKWDFGYLPKYEIVDGTGGHLIEWTIQEIYVPGYVTRTEGYDLENVYDPFGDLSLKKTVVNGTPQALEKTFTFRFTLQDASGEYISDSFSWTSSDGRSGTVENGETLTLSADETITIHDLPSESRYTLSELSADGFIQSASENLTGTIRAGTSTQASAENTYSATGSVSLQAFKTLSGAQLENHQFKFELWDENGQLLRTASNQIDGKVVFGALRYTLADLDENGKRELTYIVKESDTEYSGFTTDTSEYEVKVFLQDQGNGQIEVNVEYPDGEIPHFQNSYEASGELRLQARKVLVGEELTAGEFTFGLFDEEGNQISEAVNDAEGNVAFEPVQYTQDDAGKTYLYTVKELAGKDPDIVYDTHTETVTAKVIDNRDGTLSVITKFESPEDSASMWWTNTLEDGSLAVEKRTVGGTGEEEFTFTVQITVPAGAEFDESSITYLLEQLVDSSQAQPAEPEQEDSREDASVLDYTLLSDGTLKEESAEIIGSGTWGSASKGCKWTLDSNGVLTIEGGVAEDVKNQGSAPWNNFRDKIKKVVVNGTVNLTGVTILNYLFWNCANLTDISGLENWDVSNIQSMNNIFYGCSSLSDLSPISGWNTVNVKTLNYAFSKMTGLKELSALSGWNTASVTGMKNIFDGDTALESLRGLENWKTSSLKDLAGAFANCKALTDLTPLGRWDVSNVTTLYTTFFSCEKLTSLNGLENWDVSKVTTLAGTFQKDKDLKDVSALSAWKTGSVTNMATTFGTCTALSEIIALKNWDTSNVTSFNGTFNQCESAQEIDIENWTGAGGDVLFSAMFSGCKALKTLNVSSLDRSGSTQIGSMFSSVNVDRICIGENFFNKNLDFTAFATLPNSGSMKWIRVDGTYGPFAASELQENWQPAMAGWWEIYTPSYTVIFDANGGSGTMSPQKIPVNTTAALNPCAYTWFDHVFTGWNTSADGTGTGYSNEQNVRNLAPVDGTITLYAQWKENEHTAQVKDGTFTITVPAGTRAVIEGLPGGAQYQVVEAEKAGWSLTDSSGVSGTIAPNQTQTASFENTYTPDRMSVSLSAVKLLDETIPADHLFEFELTVSVDGSDEKILQTVSNDGSSVLFEPVELDAQAGEHTHVFRIREKDPSSSLYTGDDHIYERTVVTRLNEDGTMEILSDTESGSKTFENETKPGSLLLMKTTEGSTLNSASFTFTVFLYSALGVPLSGTYGGWSFENGTCRIPVQAGKPVVLTDLPAGTRWSVQETGMPAGWSGSQEIQEGVIAAGTVSQAEIHNTYSASGSATLQAEKSLTGMDLESSMFTFELLDEEGNPVDAASNTADGSVYFASISYDQPGTYIYTIQEENSGSYPDVVFDASVYKVTVHVTDSGTGVLNTEVIYDTEDGNPPVFENKVSDGSFTLTKTVENETDAVAGVEFEFTLSLKDRNGSPLTDTYPATIGTVSLTVTDGSVVRLQAGQTFRADALPNGAKISVQESVPDGFTLSQDSLLSGTIEAGAVLELSAVNLYEPEGQFVPEMSKTLKNGNLADYTFRFAVFDEDGILVSSGTSNADGTITFEPIEYSLKDAGKTFVYEIRELDSYEGPEAEAGADNIVLDPAVRKLQVLVMEDGSGALKTESEWLDDSSPEFVNERISWSVQVVKTDGFNGSLLSGAYFGLYSENIEDMIPSAEYNAADLNVPKTCTYDGRTWYLMSLKASDSTGLLSWDGLNRERYLLREVQAPDGYGLISVYEIAEYPGKEETIMLNVKNYPPLSMPETDGTDRSLPVLAGLLLLLLTFGILLLLERRQQSKQF